MQAAHQLEFKKYEADKLAKASKRSTLSQSIDYKQQSKKQCTFHTMFSRKQPSAETVKLFIYDYIVEEMKPLRTVESEPFKRLCIGLSYSKYHDTLNSYQIWFPRSMKKLFKWWSVP